MRKSKNTVSNEGEVALKIMTHFTPDPFEFVRVIFGRELRAFQWRWWFLMDEYDDVLGYSCMRVGKTVGVQMKCLYEELTTPWEELLIFAPALDQAVDTFQTQYDIIEEDPSGAIQPMLARAAGTGKKEFGSGFVKFINKSSVGTYGEKSNFEGKNSTIQHIDELDDITPDKLKRMLGRSVAENRNGKATRIRLTGVIWGKLNIYHYQFNSEFFTLPPVDVYQGLAAGYLNQEKVKEMRAQFTEDEWLRAACLQFVESRNFIWEAWLNASMTIGASWGLFPYGPKNSITYDKHGLIAFGLDMGAQGAGEDASDYSLQVVEAVGNYRRWVWGRTWPPDTPPDQLIEEVSEAWRFFQPDGGYGDARDANLIAQINSNLYRRGLTYYNWMIEGKNDMTGWVKWLEHGLLTPIHNNGRTKHYMFGNLQKAIFNCATADSSGATIRLVLPFADHNKAKKKPHWQELLMLKRELLNLTSERTASGYLKITRHKTREQDPDNDFGPSIKLGDDRPDALAMANHALDYIGSMRSAGSGITVAYLPGF